MRHRGSAFLPALDCKVCSPSLVKMAATATRFIDAEPTHGNLFVGMWQIHSVTLNSTCDMICLT